MSGYKRVAYISREDQDSKRTSIAADNLPLQILGENCTLSSEEDIALANINMLKQAGGDLRKARKALTDLTNVVEGGGVGAKTKAKAISIKRPAKLKS